MKTNVLKKDSSKKLNYLAGINRPINPSQVTKLAESVKKIGIIRPIVIAQLSFITGKSEQYIIDGQHLFNALIRNNMDIPYVSVEIDNKYQLVETIALLNASSKNWSMVDYVTSWGSISEHYKKLLYYFNVYDFELCDIASILSEKARRHIGRVIKKGEFEIVNEKDNVKILDYLTDVLDILPRMNRYENRYVCEEYISFIRTTVNYNHKLFIQKLEKNKQKFILATQGGEKLSEMFKKLS